MVVVSFFVDMVIKIAHKYLKNKVQHPITYRRKENNYLFKICNVNDVCTNIYILFSLITLMNKIYTSNSSKPDRLLFR
jgi:CTP:phosphocholine cytidylyltransferase-like protein